MTRIPRTTAQDSSARLSRSNSNPPRRRARWRRAGLRRRLSRFLTIALVVVMLVEQTPAAPLLLAGAASRWQWGLAFWYESSGWAKTMRGLVSPQGEAKGRGQESQSARNARVRGVRISPDGARVVPGEKVRFAAVAYDQQGNTVGGVRVKWSAREESRNRRTRISHDGEFSAPVAGVYKVTALVAGQQAQVTVTVVDGGTPLPAVKGNGPPAAVKPAPTKGVSTRELSPPEQGSASRREGQRPRRSGPRARRGLQASAVKASFGGRAEPSKASAPAQGVWGDPFGWNSVNYMTADDPGSQIGDPPGTPEDGGAGNGNFQITAPVVSLPGRGMDLTLALVYNSHLWHKTGGTITYDIDKGWPAPGWSLGFGKMVDIGDGATLISEGDGTRHGYSGTIFYPANPTSWFVGQTADGTLIDYWGSRSNFVLRTGAAQLPNGTYIDYGAPGEGAIYPTKITDSNGNLITITYRNNSGPRIETVTDTLGRAIVFHYDGNNLLTAVTAPGYDGGSARTLVRLHYQEKAIGASFPGLTTMVRDSSPWLLDAIFYPATGTGYWFGEQDSFLSGYGTLAKVVEQRGISHSAGGLGDMGTVTPGPMTRQAVYDWQATGSDAPTYTSLSETWAGMDTGPSVTGYAVNQNSTPRTVAMTLPNGVKSVQYSYNAPGQFYDGLVFKDETFDTDGVTLLARSEVSWEQGDYNSPRPRYTTVTTRTAGGEELTTGTEFTYQPSPSFNQVVEVRNYDYGYVWGGANTLLRKTVTQYENSPSYIHPNTYRHHFNLPKVVEVYAGDGTTRVSRTEYTYDGATLLNAPDVTQHELTYNPYAPLTTECGYENDPNDLDCQSPGCEAHISQCDGVCNQEYVCHDFSPYVQMTDYRGNVTQVKSYADAGAENPTAAVVETRAYDITGNMRVASTSCCEQTSIEYTLATQYAYATSQTRGAIDQNSPHRVTASATYDFNTGLVLSATDTNGRISTTAHNPDSLRTQQSTMPTGAYTVFQYDDAAMTVTETTHLAPSEGGTVASQGVTTLNGLGLPRLEEALGAGGVWDKVETVYDVMAQVLKQTRPYSAGETKQWTENEYDGLGRVTKITAPDGSVSQAFYNEPALNRPGSASTLPGETTRTRDAWGRERWGRTDALGRLVEVVEPKPSGGGAVSEAGSLKTSYTYDTLGGLTGVAQDTQARAFRYDTLGRLTHQKLAEQSATLNDAGEYVGASGTWSTVSAYDARSNIIWSVDARGVKTVFGYNDDPLDRLQTVAYVVGTPHDTSSTIASADNVIYEYKSSGDVTRLWKVTTQNAATSEYTTQEVIDYDAEGRLAQRMMTILNRGSYPMTTNYLYDSLDRVTNVTYPAQYALGVQNPARKTVHHDYDVASRLSGLKVDGADYASQVAYNAASQITSLKVGVAGANQVTESYSFDPATGLLAGQRAYRGSNPDQNRLLHLSYDYLRAGTTQGRSGQLTKLTDHLNAPRGRSYSYDALGRLTQATGGEPNASPLWTQNYTYDRFGNRETVSASGTTAARDKPQEPKPSSPTVEVAQNLFPQNPDFLRGAEGRRGLSDANGPSALPRLAPSHPLAAAALVSTPTNLMVSAASATQISLTWTAAAGASNYRVERSTSLSGSYSLAGTSASAGFADTGVTGGTAYLYRVCSADAGGNCISPFSNLALGAAFTLTDDPLVSNTTTVKAAHFNELRQLVNAVRAAANLPAATWAIDPTLTPQVTTVKAALVQELRDRLDEALAALGVTVNPFTDPALATGASGTPVKKVHVEELRQRATRGQSTLSGNRPGAPMTTDGHASLSYDETTNRIDTPGWAYDAAGNQTRVRVAGGAWQRMEYDCANRLVAVKTDAGALLASYTYGDSKARLTMREGATRTYYAWAGGSVIGEYAETDGTATALSPQWARNYIYLGGRLLATQQPNGAGGDYVEYHHPDRLGTRVVSNATDANYYEQAALPFGTALNAESTGATGRRFTSYDRSLASGLDYAVNRHYDPMQGRFTQVDPLGMEAANLNDPQTLNMYAYCANDPVNQVDPSGLGFFSFFKKLFSGIVRALRWVA
ncbi:MAG TPA: RHS repeat-associated core domain-containing protein, partial [Pyrinomonadaceae bacterium]|nr:RHS repeat-associated core domain-containing protein [Pyrinomonadaceae bacterium]